jgi:transposase-like protein
MPAPCRGPLVGRRDLRQGVRSVALCLPGDRPVRAGHRRVYNRTEADHGELKRRLRPMRGLKTDHGARIILAGHAFIQNIRRGHYELGVDEPMTVRVAAAFDELALAI